MKTLLVTQDFPPLTGGISNYYRNRVKKMKPQDIVVLMNETGKEKPDTKYTVIYTNFFTKYIWPHWLPLIFHIGKAVSQEKITHLWAGQVLPAGTTVNLVAKLKNLPYTVTCHGNDLLRAKKSSRKFKLAAKILKEAVLVEANTEFTKKMLVKEYKVIPEKIQVIRPENELTKDMVDTGRIEELKKEYHLEGSKVLITVARLVESKGIDRVIKAMEKVWQTKPNTKYLVVGDGPYSDELKKISSDNRIIFTGNIDHKDLPNYYSLADLFILTPRQNSEGDTESFGIVYLEALEFRLPAVAGDTGGAREIQDEKMNYVDSNNVEEIKDKILEKIKWPTT